MTLYLDHNSTTPMLPVVRERLLELLAQDLGNPSSVHTSGRRARALIDDARAQVAAALEVPEEWVLFTSGGTEANNAALQGAVLGAPSGEAGLVVSAGEHASVLEPARALQARGHPLALAPIDSSGVLELDRALELAGNPACCVISSLMANNEVGSLAPMAELSEGLAALGKRRPLWHVDGVQALGRVPLELAAWGVDLASFSAHKLGGPLGVGLFVRNPRAPWAPLALGGGQEGGGRAGTENAPALAAAALAVELAVAHREAYASHTRALVSALWQRLDRDLDVILLGPPLGHPARLPNTLQLLLPGLSGEALVARLDLEGLAASVGSACSSGAALASHVLLAMGATKDQARSSLRLSVGAATSHQDIHRAGDILVATVVALGPPAVHE
jgi:cysteine desulfurase